MAVEPGAPPVALLHPLVNPRGDTITLIASSKIEVRLRPALPAGGDPDQIKAAAKGSFKARTSNGCVELGISYHYDSNWHIAHVSQFGDWTPTCDRYRTPDAYLGITLSPAQAARLRGENISGVTLEPLEPRDMAGAPLEPSLTPKPPEPQDWEWRLTFYGALADTPCVYAQCGRHGPEATLMLDDTVVRWSDTATRQKFAFDEVWASEGMDRLVPPPGCAPAMLSLKY